MDPPTGGYRRRFRGSRGPNGSGEAVRGRISPIPDAAESVDTPAAGSLDTPALEYVDRRNLERIHRRTLSLLRREVEPASLYAYADFLARWQHLHPGTRLAGRAAPAAGRL